MRPHDFDGTKLAALFSALRVLFLHEIYFSVPTMRVESGLEWEGCEGHLEMSNFSFDIFFPSLSSCGILDVGDGDGIYSIALLVNGNVYGNSIPHLLHLRA